MFLNNSLPPEPSLSLVTRQPDKDIFWEAKRREEYCLLYRVNDLLYAKKKEFILYRTYAVPTRNYIQYIPFRRWLAATFSVSSPRSSHLQTDPKLLCFPLPFSAIDPTIRFVEEGFSSSLPLSELDAIILSLSFRLSAEIYLLVLT